MSVYDDTALQSARIRGIMDAAIHLSYMIGDAENDLDFLKSMRRGDTHKDRRNMRQSKSEVRGAIKALKLAVEQLHKVAGR